MAARVLLVEHIERIVHYELEDGKEAGTGGQEVRWSAAGGHLHQRGRRRHQDSGALQEDQGWRKLMIFLLIVCHPINI